MSGIKEAFLNTCMRWSLADETRDKLVPPDRILPGPRDRMAVIVGISLGLGALFDENRDAELEWLTTKRSEFSGMNAIEFMTRGPGHWGDLRTVARAVDAARGLWAG